MDELFKNAAQIFSLEAEFLVIFLLMIKIYTCDFRGSEYSTLFCRNHRNSTSSSSTKCSLADKRAIGHCILHVPLAWLAFFETVSFILNVRYDIITL